LLKKIQFTDHAKFEMKRRRIKEKIVEEIVRNPAQVIDLKEGRCICQARYFNGFEQKEMLLRIVIEETIREINVITAYKTSKFHKYWKKMR
jgi:hypothetical protein